MLQRNSISAGLNLLFPVPIALIDWKNAAEFNSWINGNLDRFEIGLVSGNRLKSEGAGRLEDLEDAPIVELHEFILRCCEVTWESLHGASFSDQIEAHKENEGRAYRERTKSDDGDFSLGLCISRSWINSYSAGQSHQMHTHPGALFGAIYCSALPEGLSPPEGSIGFQDPRRESVNHLAGARLCHEGLDAYCHLTPGQLLLFPGWLPHFVTPHTSNGNRITISCNISVAQVGTNQSAGG